jgi:hypothetical protein
MNRIRCQVLPLILTIALSVCSSSVSAAGHQDTETPDFVFSYHEDEDFALKIKNMNTGKEEQLDTQIAYTDKILEITGLEPFSLEKLQNGTADLEIYYSLEETHTEETTIDFYEKLENRTGIVEIGEIPFTLSEDEPYWRICNENGSWGIGIRGIGIPEVIYQLLPENMNGLKGISYNGIQTQENLKNSKYKNKIVLIQQTPVEEKQSILLTDLKLPGNIMQQITANKVYQSKLEIMANYIFKIKIPSKDINTDLNNCNENSLWINGKVTIRYTVDVKHDIFTNE